MLERVHISRRHWLGAVGLTTLGAGLANVWAEDAAWPDERATGVFRCHADFSLDSYSTLLDELGRLQDDLATSLGVATPQEEVHLFLFAKKATYQAYLDQYFPKVPARRALFIKGRGPGMVFAYRSSELSIDVRHESTHALLHTSVTDIPLWLDEGLAEYFEVASDQRVTKNPYTSAIRWNVRVGYVPDLQKLEGLRELGEMGKTEYRDAWAWTHFLLHYNDDTRGLLRNYLSLLAEGQRPDEISMVLQRQVGDYETAFAEHFRRWAVSG